MVNTVSRCMNERSGGMPTTKIRLTGDFSRLSASDRKDHRRVAEAFPRRDHGEHRVEVHERTFRRDADDEDPLDGRLLALERLRSEGSSARSRGIPQARSW